MRHAMVTLCLDLAQCYKKYAIFDATRVAIVALRLEWFIGRIPAIILLREKRAGSRYALSSWFKGE
jgi:hypothetical protein